MDATCTIQDSIHVFSLVHIYVSRILGTYHSLYTNNIIIYQLCKFRFSGRAVSHERSGHSALNGAERRLGVSPQSYVPVHYNSSMR